MKIVRIPQELKSALRAEEGSIGFVPTMGALHSGHRTLIEKAREQNAIVVVSIFVNPTQFLEGEDLEKYPRRFEADEKICRLCGVDYLFYPAASDMYGTDEVGVKAPDVRGYLLEGRMRPGHFDGVLTVVNKLLNIVNPTNAYFGKKDAQQLFLINEMVANLFMDVNVVAVDTVRESDGLALSSRNVYLGTEEREESLKISKSLKRAAKMVGQGVRDSAEIRKAMEEILMPLNVEYVALVDRRFNPLDALEPGNTIVLIAARVGTTRLIDNIWI